MYVVTRKMAWAIFFVACAVGIVALVIGLGGCASAPEKETGSIEVTITDGVRPLYLPPPISMTVGTYQIDGAGPDSESFSTVITGTSTIIEGLLPGLWNLTVTAFNDEDPPVAIGDGAASVDVVIGEVTPVTVDVKEFSGTGSMSGTVTWEPDVVNNVFMQGELKDGAGVQTDLFFNVDAPNCTATTSEPTVDVGFYSIINRLYDGDPLLNGVLVGGFADIIRIISNFETVWSKHVFVQEATGGLEVNINLEILDPIVVNSDVEQGAVHLYNDKQLPITVSVDPAVGAVIATWYVNGNQKAVDYMTYTLNSVDFDPSDYPFQVDCLVWDTAGLHAGAAHWLLHREDVDQSQLEITGTFEVIDEGYAWEVVVFDMDLNQVAIQSGSISVNPVSFAFAPLPAEDYYLRAWAERNPAMSNDNFEWYRYDDGEDIGTYTTPPSGVDIVTLPHPVGTTYDFGSIVMGQVPKP